MDNTLSSPSSSPTSVAIHQDSLRQRSPPEASTPKIGGSKRNNGVSTRRDTSLAEDMSSDCSTSNPQQGTITTSMHSAASLELEGMRTIVEQPSSRTSRHSQQQRPGGTGGPSRTGKPQEAVRQKRPPRLIDTRPNMKIPPTHKDNRKLFVGGLPLDVSADEFYRYFLHYGVILDSVVMFDKATQRCRGFGFVTFEDPQVCADLLKLGGAIEASSEGTGAQNGYLEMRGKVIEIKRAQPKSASSPGGSPLSSDKSSTHSGASHNNRRLSENAKSYSPPHQSMSTESHHSSEIQYGSHLSYEQQHQLQMQQQHHQHHQPMMNHQHRQFVPATPISIYSTDLSGSTHHHQHRAAPPMTPQQAVLDLAHHMLFYSQLLATPTLMSHHMGMVSPMLSPGMMGVPAYGDYFQPFYGETAQHSLSPAPPPGRLRKVPEGESFEIGGGKFFRETPLSPALDDRSQPCLRQSTVAATAAAKSKHC